MASPLTKATVVYYCQGEQPWLGEAATGGDCSKDIWVWPTLVPYFGIQPSI